MDIVKKEKKSLYIPISLTLGILGIILIILGLFADDNIDRNIKFVGFMSDTSLLAAESGDTQYIFDSRFDNDFIQKVSKISNIVFNIKYKSSGKVSFHVGDTTKSKTVESYELYDTDTGLVLKSNDIDSLLIELGYHSFGEHEEEAKVIEVDTYSNSRYLNNVVYKYYDLQLELKSGKIVDAEYRIFDNEDKISLLKENESYVFKFEVVEGKYDVLLYVINDFE